MTNVAKIETAAERLPQSAPSQADGMISMLERVLMDPSIPIERLERLVELQEKAVARQARTAFMSAMADMQMDLPVIDERGAIRNNKGEVQSTYAKWADVNEAIMPVLKINGFSLTFKVATPDKITVTGILSHREGHSEETSITLPHDSSGSKNAVQAVASSVQYGKRYTAGALLNLTSRAREDADDDGQAAGGKPMLSEEQVEQIRKALAFRDVPEERALKRFGVVSLFDIYADKFDACLKIAQAAGARQ